jgi:hypothetical protein
MGVERSHLVGLICWVLILGGLGGLALAMKAIGTPAFAGWLALYPFSPAVTATLAFGLRALLVATGICLYERQGWARYVYIALMPAFFIFQFLGLGQATNATEAHKLVQHQEILEAGVVLWLASLVILFLPSTNRYYHPPMYVDE